MEVERDRGIEHRDERHQRDEGGTVAQRAGGGDALGIDQSGEGLSGFGVQAVSAFAGKALNELSWPRS